MHADVQVIFNKAVDNDRRLPMYLFEDILED
jgi:hypothetical protein